MYFLLVSSLLLPFEVLTIILQRNARHDWAKHAKHEPVANGDVKTLAVIAHVTQVVVLFEEHVVELDRRTKEVQLLSFGHLCFWIDLLKETCTP